MVNDAIENSEILTSTDEQILSISEVFGYHKNRKRFVCKDGFDDVNTCDDGDDDDESNGKAYHRCDANMILLILPNGERRLRRK